jgi:hypothetical protein
MLAIIFSTKIATAETFPKFPIYAQKPAPQFSSAGFFSKQKASITCPKL